MKKNSDSFYDSKKWESVRKSALIRDHYQDAVQKRYGIFRTAEMVHHVIPRETHPEYQYELWNLISLTKSMHNRMHDRITDELTDEGLKLMERICRKYNKEIPPEYSVRIEYMKKHKPKIGKWMGYY